MKNFMSQLRSLRTRDCKAFGWFCHPDRALTKPPPLRPPFSHGQERWPPRQSGPRTAAQASWLCTRIARGCLHGSRRNPVLGFRGRSGHLGQIKGAVNSVKFQPSHLLICDLGGETPPLVTSMSSLQMERWMRTSAALQLYSHWK